MAFSVRSTIRECVGIKTLAGQATAAYGGGR